MINLSMNLPLYILFLSFVLFGNVLISILVHEGVHVLQSKEVQKICLNVGDKDFMQVWGIYPLDYPLEKEAYIINAGYLLISSFFIVKKLTKGQIK